MTSIRMAGAVDTERLDPNASTTLDISRPVGNLPAVHPESTPTEIAAAIQGRFDYLHAHRLNGRIVLPPGHWQINRPIFMNGDSKELIGSGVGQTFLEAADGYRDMPMINVGARTVVEYRPLQTCNRVRLTDPAARVLDSSVSGEHYGLRTYTEYPPDNFPAIAHRQAPNDAKAWASGTRYKVDDAVALPLLSAPGPALAVCTTEHAASEQNQPGKGADWKQCWIIQVPSHVQVVGDPLAAGAFDPIAKRASNWVSMDHFTLDLAFTQNADPKTYGEERMLCGVVTGQPDRPNGFVWKVMLHENGDITFNILLNDSTSKTIQIASKCSGVGSYRVAAQIDFKTHAVQGWTRKPGEPSFVRSCNDRKTIPDGAHFTQLEYGYFVIAGGDGSAPNSNGRNNPATDITVCGLHTSAELRYAEQDALIRLDTNKTTDDQFCYFANDDGTMAFLPLTDNPAENDMDTQGLLVTVQHGNAAGDAHQKGYGYLKVPLQIYGIGMPHISDMTVTPGPVWGVGVLTWHTLALQLKNLDIQGGFYAVGDLFFGAQYPIDVRNCRLSGSEAAFNGMSNIIYMKDVVIDPVGRYGILLSGSNIIVDGLTFGDPQTHRSDCYFRHIASADYGGMNILENVRMQAPAGSEFPSRAAFSQETIGLSRTSIVLRNCSAANMGNKAAFLDLPLVDYPCPAKILMENCTYKGSPIPAWVHAQSPWWSGEVLNFDPHAPVSKYLDSPLPPYTPWKAGSAYRKDQHVIFDGRAWQCEHEQAVNAGHTPGTPEGQSDWTQLMPRIFFEPGPPKE